MSLTPCHTGQGSVNRFSVKHQIVTVLGFVGHVVSVTVTQV